MLHAGAQVDDEPAVVVPRVFVVHALFYIDINAADGVDDFLKGAGVDDDVVVDADTEQILDGALCELFPAVGIRGVDLVVAVLRDGDARVARDGEQRRLVLGGVDGGDHEGVAAADVARALIDAHDHDGRLVLGGEQLLLLLGLAAVEQAALGEVRARRRREDEDEDGAEQDVGPDAALFRPSFRW